MTPCPQCQESFRNDLECLVIIVTDILMVGVDFPNIQDVIVLGVPPDTNNYFQKIRRAGRNRKLVPDPRAIIYITKSAKKNAKLVINLPKPSTTNSTDKLPTVDPSMATLILTQCKTEEHQEKNDRIGGFSMALQALQGSTYRSVAPVAL